MSNKLMYRLGLEELEEPVLEAEGVDAADAMKLDDKASELQSNIQSDVAITEQLKDDHETLQDAAVALEAALKNGYPVEALVFIRKSIQRIDNRWGMHHRIVSMESARSDAELIASMESAVIDGVKKTGQAIWEMLKKLWAKIREWVGLLVQKLGNSVKALGAKLRRSKELVEIVPKDELNKADHALMAQAIGNSANAMALTMFSMDGANKFGGVDILKHIAASLGGAFKTMGSINDLLGHIYDKSKSAKTVDELGSHISEFVKHAYSKHFTGESDLSAAAGAPDAWVLEPLLSIGYGVAVTNAAKLGDHNNTPPVPKLAIHKTNAYVKLENTGVEVDEVAKRVVILEPGKMDAIGVAYEEIVSQIQKFFETFDQRFNNISNNLAKQRDALATGENKNMELARYLQDIISESGSMVTMLFNSISGYRTFLYHVTDLYVDVMNAYWEAVSKKAK